MEETRKTILVVDDDEHFVQSVYDLLTNEGYEVIKAYNGKDGYDLAKKEHPDLMILDVMMTHDTEGFEVSRKIPQTPEIKDMPVILVTGITSEMNLPFKFEPDESWLPVDKILEKPVAPDRLLDEIRKRLKSN